MSQFALTPETVHRLEPDRPEIDHKYSPSSGESNLRCRQDKTFNFSFHGYGGHGIVRFVVTVIIEVLVATPGALRHSVIERLHRFVLKS
jgi:hypothetical protein